MAYPTGMMEFALLASMRRRERDRATTPLMMTMVPGPASQRSALAAVAVATEVQDSIRREGRAADAVPVALSAAIAAKTAITLDDLKKIPALRDVADDALVTALNDVLAVVQQGTRLIEAFEANTAKPLAAKVRPQYTAFLTLLNPAQQAVLVKP